MTSRLAPSPARLGRLGLAFFIAAFVLLAWGALHDAASAEEAAATDPVEAAAPAEEADGPPAAAIDEEAAPVAPEEEPDAPVTEAEAPVAEDEADSDAVVADEPVVAADKEPLVVVPDAPVARALEQAAPAEVEVSANVETALVAPPAVHQCNADTYPTSAGWEATCVVIVENTVGDDGATSSTVTTIWCLAEAGVLPPEGCDSDVVTSDQLVTTIDQCNGILAGGSNVTCSVEVINNVPFGTPTTGVTVNQCIGSGQGGVSPDGPPTNCDPEDSSTSGATVTQCNGSANGGGGPERVQCTVDGAVTAIPVTVNQCNGSTAAGSTVTCDVTFTNNFAAAVVEPDTIPPTTLPTDDGTVATDGDAAGDDDDAGRTATFSAASSSRSSSRSTATATGTTGLAATGASTGSLLAVALLWLVLGSLLLAGSKGRLA